MPDIVKLPLKSPGSEEFETVWSEEIGQEIAIEKYTFFYPGDTIKFVVERIRKPKKKESK